MPSDEGDTTSKEGCEFRLHNEVTINVLFEFFATGVSKVNKPGRVDLEHCRAQVSHKNLEGKQSCYELGGCEDVSHGPLFGDSSLSVDYFGDVAVDKVSETEMAETGAPKSDLRSEQYLV